MRRAWGSIIHRRWFSGTTLLLIAVVGLLILLLIEPLIQVVITSLGFPFSSAAYRDIFEVAVFRTIIRNTFLIAAVVMVLTLTVGFPYAYYLWNQQGLWRVICSVAVFVPFFTGILVKNLSWTVILRDNGILNSVLEFLRLPAIHILFTRTAVYVGMVQYLLPFAILPIYASLNQLDRRLLLAARSLGARPASVFLNVTLPLVARGVVASAVIVFISALGFFVTPAMLGGRGDQMIANIINIYANQLADFTTSAAFAVVISATVLCLTPLALRQLRPGAGGSPVTALLAEPKPPSARE